MNAVDKIMSLIRSNDDRSGSGINVRFADAAPFQLQIKHAMKTSAAIQNQPIIPSLFQIAARMGDFTPALISESSPPNQTPFADLMLHPDKLEAALKTARSENDAFDAKRKFSQNPAKRATRSATSKCSDGPNTGNSSTHSLIELKPTAFHLDAP
jgi:hypothetical protein